jgi:hypothetical protein
MCNGKSDSCPAGATCEPCERTSSKGEGDAGVPADAGHRR